MDQAIYNNLLNNHKNNKKRIDNGQELCKESIRVFKLNAWANYWEEKFVIY